jgi:hypothetical protein
MNVFGKRAAVALGVVGLAVAGVAVRTTGASAAGSYPLVPTSNVAYGTGSVGVDYAGPNVVVHIDISGARPATLFKVSACANYGGLQCNSDPANDLMMTDTNGAFHGSFAVPAPSRTDAVTLVDQRDANDGYQAAINPANYIPPSTVYVPQTPVYAPTLPYINPAFPYVYNPVVRYPFVVTTGNPNAMVFVPLGTSLQPGVVCPAGFHGPLVVGIGGYGYPFFTPFTWPFTGLPASAYTMTVNC